MVLFLSKIAQPFAQAHNLCSNLATTQYIFVVLATIVSENLQLKSYPLYTTIPRIFKEAFEQ